MPFSSVSRSDSRGQFSHVDQLPVGRTDFSYFYYLSSTHYCIYLLIFDHSPFDDRYHRSGNKTQCDFCTSKAMRRSRAKKEREQTQLQGGETGGEAASAAVPNAPGYHHVEQEDGISSLYLSHIFLN